MPLYFTHMRDGDDYAHDDDGKDYVDDDAAIVGAEQSAREILTANVRSGDAIRLAKLYVLSFYGSLIAVVYIRDQLNL